MRKPRSEPKKKRLIYIFHYIVDVGDDPNITEIMDKMQETGGAKIVDVRIESDALVP